MAAKKDIIKSVKDTYNTIGGQFSATRNYIWPDLKPFLSKVPSKASVLDVGCGNGRLLLGLPKDIKYTGIDISRKLLDEAEKAHPETNFIETDITKPNIWKHLPKYDYIFCVAVMHHIPTKEDQLFILNQIKDHLKPNGKCLITVWNLWQKKYLKYHLDPATKWQNPYWVMLPMFKTEKRFCFAYTKLYLESLLVQAKFKLKIHKTLQNYLLSNY